MSFNGVLVPLVFLLGWGLAYFTTLVSPTRTIFILDSGHYLFTAGSIMQNLSSLLNPFASISPQLGADIMLDGPVLSSFTAACILICGKAALGTCWPWVAAMIASWNGVSAACIMLLARRICGDDRFAFVTAVAWCFYPAALIASGRLLTEPLAVMFMLILMVLSCRLTENTGRSVLVGISTGIVSALGFLLKPVLVLLWLLIPAYALTISICRHQRSLPRILSFLVGFVVIMAPWVDLGFRATGRLCLSPQRVPAHNVAKGQDLTADGWSTDPCSSQTAEYETMGSLPAIKLAWTRAPWGMADLYLRKIPRTVAFLWNDFRQSCLGLDCDQQNYIQGILLGLAIFGGAAALLEAQIVSFPLNVTAFAFILQPLLYLPFEAITRYGFCVSPFMMLLCCYGLCRGTTKRRAVLLIITGAVFLIKAVSVEFPALDAQATAWARGGFWALILLLSAWLLWSCLKLRLRASMGRRLAIGGLLLVMGILPAVCVGFHNVEFTEVLNLDAGQRLIRKVNLGGQMQGLQEPLMLVDYKGPAHFMVNGTLLRDRPLSLNKLDGNYFSLYNLLRFYSAILDEPVEELRQWRVLRVPGALLHDGENELIIEADGKVQMFADRLSAGKPTVHLPGRGISTGYMCNGNSGSEMRLPDPEQTELAQSTFEIVKNGSSKKLSQFLAPRIFLAVADPVAVHRAVAPAAVLWAIDTSSFPPAFRSVSESLNTLRINRYSFQLAGPAVVERELPKQFSNWPLLDVSIRGKVRATGRSRRAGVMATLAAKEGSPFMILPSCSPAITCEPGYWTDFEIRDVMPTDMLNGQGAKLIISLFPGRWEQMAQYGGTGGSFEFKGLQATIGPCLWKPITGRKLHIY